MTITALPTAPNRATDSAATFSSKADALLAALVSPFVSEANATATACSASQVAAAASASSAAAQEVLAAAQVTLAATQATTAASSAAAAAASANLKGTWASQTGAIAKPASVTHNSKVWGLLNNLADVTASQPGVTADWVDITPAANAYAVQKESALVTLAYTGGQLYDTLSIDSTRELLIFTSNLGNGVQAVVWNNTTKAFGSMTAIRNTGSALAVGSLLIGTDKVLMLTAPVSAATLEAVVLTFSGTTITVNTAATQTMPQALHSNTPDGKTDGFCHRGVACGSSYVFSMKLATSARCIAVTVSGTTPTIGTSLSMVGPSLWNTIKGIDSTRLLALYLSGGNATALPITVSAGTTLTAGTAATFTASAWRYFAALSTGRFAIVYTNTNSYGAIVSVSGTVATASTAVLNAAADLGQGSVVKIGDQLIVQCSTTKVNVLTDVAGTATAGTAVTTPTLASALACCGFGTDYAVFGGTGTYTIVKLSGNNPSVYDTGKLQALGMISGSQYGWDDSQPFAVLTNSTKSIVAASSVTTALAFDTNGPLGVRFLAPVSYDVVVNQSDSVMWAAYMPTNITSIRITRVELI